MITVEYPEPLEECIDVEIAEIDTKCDHDDDEYCVECAHIRDSKEDVTADKVPNDQSNIYIYNKVARPTH